MSIEELRAKIEKAGVHEALGPTGDGLGIEQNPQELATFLSFMEDVHSALEVGTGYKAGLALFLHHEMNWDVSSVDIRDYGHNHPGVAFYVEAERKPFVRKFDLVLIDADKSYEAVELDYVHYGAFATKAVALCGIAGLRGCEGVAQFWRELAYTKTGKLKKGFFEAVADTDTKSGIGWVTK